MVIELYRKYGIILIGAKSKKDSNGGQTLVSSSNFIHPKGGILKYETSFFRYFRNNDYYLGDGDYWNDMFFYWYCTTIDIFLSD